ncbi:tetratricopeptide repeat protein [Ferrovum sp.]|uniref:tetratricopeptide repeat protein n=1 Tax=Ferrovum sp. TaxID=2609467 RepID=UPI00261BD8ED|nr:tetratricopeptide repeat protein [Ferrovum sp.]
MSPRKLLISLSLALGFLSNVTARAETMEEGLAAEQHAWAKGRYSLPEDKREDYFSRLQLHAHDLSLKFPNRAAPLIWEGIITATHAEYQTIFSARGTAKVARDLLLKAITIDPNALDGSGLVSLGALYFKVPRFGSFGNDDKAREYLQRALKVDPDNIDANYFYGEFLLEQGDKSGALMYLTKAIHAPPRPGRKDADEGRRAAALALLNKAQQ